MFFRKKGFTLIELLIVIAIIGILAVALVPTGMNALKKARDATRIAHVAAISKALDEYFLDNEGSSDAWKINKAESNGRAVIGTSNPIYGPSTELQSYLPKTPLKDPSGTHSFIKPGEVGAVGDYIVVFSVDANKDTYFICSYIEFLSNANLKELDSHVSQPWYFVNVSASDLILDKSLGDDVKAPYYCVKNKTF